MMAKLYTRAGDAGTTGLLGPERVSKDNPRVEAMGAVDELNAVIGLALVSQISSLSAPSWPCPRKLPALRFPE
jgi:cob(I)alamin adenosyltransferase